MSDDQGHHERRPRCAAPRGAHLDPAAGGLMTTDRRRDTAAQLDGYLDYAERTGDSDGLLQLMAVTATTMTDDRRLAEARAWMDAQPHTDPRWAGGALDSAAVLRVGAVVVAEYEAGAASEYLRGLVNVLLLMQGVGAGTWVETTAEALGQDGAWHVSVADGEGGGVAVGDVVVAWLVDAGASVVTVAAPATIAATTG